MANKQLWTSYCQFAQSGRARPNALATSLLTQYGPFRATSAQEELGNQTQDEAAMHRIVVTVFDSESEAEAGRNKLLELDSEGAIGTYGYAVITKEADGTVVLKELDRHGTLSPFANSLLASLCDSAYPADESAATRAGESADSKKSKKAENFIREVTEVMLPNRVAIVAELEEEWPPILDRRMESIGGVMFRWELSEVEQALDRQDGGV